MINLHNYKDNLSMVNSISKEFRDFIREFKDEVDWEYISEYQKLSGKFIREFQDEVDWCCVSYRQKLTENFIRKFKNKVSWFWVSRFQKLTEDFIREFQNDVDWGNISEYQKVSKKFLKEFNLKSNLLNSVHYCGNINRVIYINKNQPNIINIGCFKGTKEEAIAAVKKKYINPKKYIFKIKECFNTKED